MSKRVISGAACAFLLGGAAQAATINLSTGLDAGGVLQTSGDAADANWRVTGANDPKDPVGHTAYVVGSGSADWYWGWTGNGASSSWIAANPDNPSGNGLMTFTRTFTLSNPASATLSGAWAVDDAANLILNGHVISSLGSGYWGGLSAFSASNGDVVSGVNTLTIQLTANDNYLEAARLEGAVSFTPAGAAPEAASWVLLIVGFGGLGAMLRRERKAVAAA